MSREKVVRNSTWRRVCDQLVAAEISGNKLYIPLNAFKMHRWPGGEQIASISITVTGSVGRMHMPESTALLSVWF